ncbi:hypothetical protein LPTSP3_g36170 [Leptospira kobayashii]|uniref:Lipoprotein n=1 Tax=Leptospira kobayashii TaxID=1917830 RepID=A0ABM7UNH3_9LEPT|nr:hypothetical protein [Leptospira kobayashii]BDA80687.1 hypothetical protein LPTSP3_g36170 [Leptospira kobayashii]
MKKSISLILSIAALAAFVACSSGPKKDAPVAVTGKGTVSVLKEGGIVIESEGKKYAVSNPDKLDKKFKKDKAKIEFAGNATGEALEITTAK